MAQPIISRSSDGLRFEPCLHPGMVRCEACLGMVEPAQVEQHKCQEWWNPDALLQPGQEVGRLDRFNPPPRILRQHRK